MKDWFQALGLAPEADDDALRARLDAGDLDDDAREALTQILLHPARRAVYQAALRTAREAACVRAALGIEDVARWPAARWRGFAPKPAARRTIRRALRARFVRPWRTRAALAAIALALGGLIVALVAAVRAFF